ncbi:aspartyl protease family protein [Candidatus Korobacter versatilis]|uniref:aspartyl protease family protein n=1 Tax=Candidatus Korobacter versatilis TaxID=658062 RepID=UPI0002EBEEC7|nr:aspartyl protease family protein [Candidatus Koribacter versatilis]
MPLLLVLLCALPLFAQSPTLEQQALDAWRTYDYPTAERLYRQALTANPTSGDAHGGLVRTLLNEKNLQAARDAANTALRAAPDSAAVQAASGDVFFRDGRIEDAEIAYRRSAKLDDNCARAWHGLSQIAQITSNYRSARRDIFKAHELDPKDPEIYESWASRLPRPERRKAVEYLVDHHGHLDPDRLNILQSRLAWLIVLGNKTAWKLVSTRETAKLRLDHIVSAAHLGDGRFTTPPREGAVAIHVRFNDKKTVSLLLDTGASGIVLRKSDAAKAEIKQVYDIATKGIGDEKPANGYLGWAHDVKIGPIEFENVPVTVLDARFPEGSDGLMGIDVFEHFLITLDIKNSELSLAPLPEIPANLRDEAGAADRYVAPAMQSFDRVMHLGAHILVSTSVDQQPAGLFFLDTGAFDTQIDPNNVSKSKLQPAPGLSVRGLSGNVRDVYVASNVQIQFGRFTQDNFRMVAISMDKLSEGEGIALGGILGFPLLSQFRLTIDYRDGLVNFDYHNSNKR